MIGRNSDFSAPVSQAVVGQSDSRVSTLISHCGHPLQGNQSPQKPLRSL